jgi:hypothetical protein
MIGVISEPMDTGVDDDYGDNINHISIFEKQLIGHRIINMGITRIGALLRICQALIVRDIAFP